MTGVLVENLPPNVSIEEISEAFQKYGDVALIQKLAPFYNSHQYDLNSCYVYFTRTEPVKYIFMSDIDIVIDGYYLEMSQFDSKRISCRALILGVPQYIDEDELSSVLFLDEKSHISIERCDDDELGYAIIEFDSAAKKKLFIDANYEVKIDEYTMDVQSFPEPVDNIDELRIYDLRITDQDFSVLRSIEKFNDFTLHTSYGDFMVSSVVLASVSNVVDQMMKEKNPKYELTLKTSSKKGNMDEFISAVYGAPINITRENADFIHEVASELQIDSLILFAGKIRYETLTIQNIKYVFKDLYKKNLNYDFVIEYIVTHFNEILSLGTKNFFCDFPPHVIQEIASSPTTAKLSKDQITDLFGNAISSGLLDESCIFNTKNASLDINKYSQLLIDSIKKFEQKE